MPQRSLQDAREFLKDTVRLHIDFAQTDQNKGIAPPPLEKPFDPDKKRIPLVKPRAWQSIKPVTLQAALEHRRSRRRFKTTALTLEELSFLLWATQGLKRRFGNEAAFRTVPSAGARHALETYLCLLRVEGLQPGLYRYLPLEHELLLEYTDNEIALKLVAAVLGQQFVAASAAVFIWAALPYRMEWRYGLAAHKVIALDTGHVCQNLYLACEAIDAGTCAIAAYNQQAIDTLLGINGQDEFTIYLAPVGKV
ncbi:MAG TPA: thioester oxidase [Candidatus Omnitrophica bacterium]|nr:thioester oxidase [Candidatus Omnitrophota bacterium]